MRGEGGCEDLSLCQDDGAEVAGSVSDSVCELCGCEKDAACGVWERGVGERVKAAHEGGVCEEGDEASACCGHGRAEALVAGAEGREGPGKELQGRDEGGQRRGERSIGLEDRRGEDEGDPRDLGIRRLVPVQRDDRRRIARRKGTREPDKRRHSPEEKQLELQRRVARVAVQNHLLGWVVLGRAQRLVVHKERPRQKLRSRPTPRRRPPRRAGRER